MHDFGPDPLYIGGIDHVHIYISWRAGEHRGDLLWLRILIRSQNGFCVEGKYLQYFWSLWILNAELEALGLQCPQRSILEELARPIFPSRVFFAVVIVFYVSSFQSRCVTSGCGNACLLSEAERSCLYLLLRRRHDSFSQHPWTWPEALSIALCWVNVGGFCGMQKAVEQSPKSAEMQ